MYRTAPLLRSRPPPPFRNLLPGKRGGGGGGGGVTTRTCTFASQLSPPPPTNLRTEINEALLCGRRRELLRSTCRGSTEGWKSCWPHMLPFFLQNIVLQPDSSHRPRDQGRMTCRILASGNCPRSAKTSSQTTFYTLNTRLLHARYTISTRLIHDFYTRNTLHVQELQYRKPARAARGGGRIMEVNNPIHQKIRGGG